jgi:adenine/guanine phosphoribosyltransferase-like PRPP-binding protein
VEPKYRPLFQWQDEKLEDVRFWCEPELTTEAVRSIETFEFPAYDCLVSFEARGFFLAGMAAMQFQKPVIPVRKHKAFYEKMAHAKIEYINWKGEREALTVLKNTLPAARRALVIDDIFDTGRSLEAGAELLAGLGIELVGAFYLLNAGSEQALSKFKFPIHSIAKQKLF